MGGAQKDRNLLRPVLFPFFFGCNYSFLVFFFLFFATSLKKPRAHTTPHASITLRYFTKRTIHTVENYPKWGTDSQEEAFLSSSILLAIIFLHRCSTCASGMVNRPIYNGRLEGTATPLCGLSCSLVRERDILSKRLNSHPIIEPFSISLSLILAEHATNVRLPRS